jgi:hypothetical protein
MKHRYVRQRARHRAMTPGGKVLMKSTAVVMVAASGGMLFGDAQAPAVASAPVTPSPLAPAFAADSYTVAPTPPTPSATASPSGTPAAPAPPGTAQLVQKPPVRPVAGLDQSAMDNAAIIVRVGRDRGVPQRGLVVAVATAMQESDLHNVASGAVPSSLSYAHQGVSQDADSVGLFQQRPSQGWGSVGQLMDPEHSTALFFDALARVPGWESMSVTAAAQAVQRSAFPNAYSKHQSAAETVVQALL